MTNLAFQSGAYAALRRAEAGAERQDIETERTKTRLSPRRRPASPQHGGEYLVFRAGLDSNTVGQFGVRTAARQAQLRLRQTSRTDEVGAAEVGASEISLFEVGAAEVGAVEVGVAEVYDGEVGAGEIGSAEVGAAKMGPFKVGVGEVDAREVGAGEVGAGEVGA